MIIMFCLLQTVSNSKIGSPQCFLLPFHNWVQKLITYGKFQAVINMYFQYEEFF